MKQKLIHLTTHASAVFALMLPFVFEATEVHANQQQYRALMTKFFLSPNRYAIPLFSNGNVKSGDVLKMPQEATYLSRNACYDLKDVKYTSLNSESLKTSFDIAGQIGGSIPLQKIAAVEAELEREVAHRFVYCSRSIVTRRTSRRNNRASESEGGKELRDHTKYSAGSGCRLHSGDARVSRQAKHGREHSSRWQCTTGRKNHGKANQEHPRKLS